MGKNKVSFDQHYQNLYEERWESIKTAFKGQPSYFELNENFKKSYFLDIASVEAAKALEIQPGEIVLDMCAAPGGKTLCIASRLKGTGNLTSNERSADRRGRLRRVLDEHLTLEWMTNITVTGHDATKWGLYEENMYDKVLLDAPCSSERHVFLSPEHLKLWSESRVTHLAIQQFAMLAAALNAVKPGGLIVYSTCSINPAENDNVIEKLFKKRSGLFEVDNNYEPISDNKLVFEKTKYGWRIMPDTSSGAGPIYFARIRKAAAITNKDNS